TSEMIYKCTFPRCGQCFDTKVVASLHSKIHGLNVDGKYLWCSEEDCHYKVPFFRFYDLLRHLNVTHSIQYTSKENTCELCALSFDTEEEVISHMDYHYNNRYKCIQCGCMLMTWQQVQEHLPQCEDSGLSKRSIGCPYCPFVFHKRSIRNLHMHAHTDTGLKCPVCDKAFRASKSLEWHMRKVHGDEIPCEKCDFVARSRNLLAIHMRTKHIEREHYCSECSKTFGFYHELKAHLARHARNLVHPCTACGEEFTKHSDMRKH
ncbi:hypothetical protein CAPTEDRAFT_74658, partial [Capitella teleta]